MNHRRHKAIRFEKLSWITKKPVARVGFLSNKYIRFQKSPILACISSRITTDIQVVRYYQINYNWFNEPFAVSQYKCLYLDMHGLIFETSIWLLAGSTRFLSFGLSYPLHKQWVSQAIDKLRCFYNKTGLRRNSSLPDNNRIWPAKLSLCKHRAALAGQKSVTFTRTTVLKFPSTTDTQC